MKKIRDNFYLVMTALIFILFAYITYLTPIVGDDWLYAMAGRVNNPFILAYEHYFSWAGRFFSELACFIVAPHKWLFNILNPIMFASIYYFIYRIISPKQNKVLISIVIAFLMLSVKDQVRMETYSWLTGGCTYVIPLFLCIPYIYIVKHKLLGVGTRKILWSVILSLLAFYIGLCLEHISAGMILLNVCFLVYSYFNHKGKWEPLVSPTIMSIISFVILRLSPGSNYRLTNDHPTWLNYSILEQIGINWGAFIRYTFIENKYLIFTLSLVVILVAVSRINKNKNNFTKTAIIVGWASLTTLFSMSEVAYSITKLDFLRILFDLSYPGALIVTSVVYLGFVGIIIFFLFTCFAGEGFYEPLLYLLVGGSFNIVMMASPIFASRSSLYTIYFIILLICYLISTVKIDKLLYIGALVVFMGLNIVKVNEYIYKYRLVAVVQKEREVIIAYYQAHPEELEIWLPRMPIYTIHSADIEEDNTHHQQTFLAYYGLNPNAKIKLYVRE